MVRLLVSAVRGISGLQNYKFGKAVTIPFSEEGFVSETPYNVIHGKQEDGTAYHVLFGH